MMRSPNDGAQREAPQAQSVRGRGGGRKSGKWSREEIARVVQVGREQRGLHLGEAGFTELAGQLGRTVKSVYSQWMRVQTPQKSKKRRASVAGGATGRARLKMCRETSVGRGVDDEVDGAGSGAGAGQWLAALPPGTWSGCVAVFS